MCRLYGVTRVGYYAWRRRPRSARANEDDRLFHQIEKIFQDSRSTYGSPRVHEAMKNRGAALGRKRVARLMRSRGLKARCARIYIRNPGRHMFYTGIPNRSLDCQVSGANQVWVGDITYLRVGNAWLYLAVVLDKYSRKVVGWKLSRFKTAWLTREALDRAVRKRQPQPGLVFHTDRGIEYGAYAYRRRLDRLGITQSMNRPGSFNQNAVMESFFHSLKAEGVHGTSFGQEDEVASYLKSYVQFYNEQRIHSALGYKTPVAFEQTQGGLLGVN
jgi:transposase InsO family protein